MSLRLALCFLLLSFSAKLWSVAADAAPSPVLDITGKKLQTGTNYYILPVMHGRGGGLTLARTSKTTSSPLDVVQEQHEFSHGLPLTFLPVNPKKGVVRVSPIITSSSLLPQSAFNPRCGNWTSLISKQDSGL